MLLLISVPPQNGEELPTLTRATCQGYSFLVAGCPPTILNLLVCGTPHLHCPPVSGDGAGTGAGAGVGGWLQECTSWIVMLQRMTLMMEIILMITVMKSE